MQCVAIVGVGLIGGSFGLALRKAGFTGPILGISSPRSLSAALQVGAVTEGADLHSATRRADLLYLAQPISQILVTLQELGRLPMRPECLVTDAGSTKVEICRTAQECLPAGSFLGGHPMAGKEQRGVEHAEADLFRGRPYVLTRATDDADLCSPAVADFREWLQRIGAETVEMTPDEHDRTVAYTSHLPQLLSTALATTLGRTKDPAIREIFGSGLLDMTRLSLSTSDVWASILSSNKLAIKKALEDFGGVLEELRKQLEEEDVGALFESGSALARVIRTGGKTVKGEGY